MTGQRLYLWLSAVVLSACSQQSDGLVPTITKQTGGTSLANPTTAQEAPALSTCPKTLMFSIVDSFAGKGGTGTPPSLDIEPSGASLCSYEDVYGKATLAATKKIGSQTARSILGETRRLLSTPAPGTSNCAQATDITLLIVRGRGRDANFYFPANGCFTYVAVAGLGSFHLDDLPKGVPTLKG